MPAYTLKVTSLEAYPAEASLTNVVFCVNWALDATDGTFSTCMSGSTDVPAPDAASFIPFDQLTEAVVLGWVRAYTPQAKFDDCERQMADWLVAQHSPTVVTPPLPWAETQEQANAA